MKTTCSLGHHHNGFVSTPAFGHMIHRTLCAQVHDLKQSPCDNNQESTLFS